MKNAMETALRDAQNATAKATADHDYARNRRDGTATSAHKKLVRAMAHEMNVENEMLGAGCNGKAI